MGDLSLIDSRVPDQEDLRLISEGRHERLWEILGAHPRRAGGVDFAVWAPNAREVAVHGDFDGWSRQGAPMRSLGPPGIWHLFVPHARVGGRYKLWILGADGVRREKTDPIAFSTEGLPGTASVVTRSEYRWTDDEWLTRRKAIDWLNAPMSIYEVHVGSWRHGLNYRQLAEELSDYLYQTGFTHVELLPVAEHPFCGSWGYQVTSYYAPSSRFGSPDDFRYLVDYMHERGIGVLLDWVPAHFPRDSWALARFDGTAQYEHADPQRGEHPEWGTLVFDHGRAEVRAFLVSNALYWLEQFHVDGIRVDAVSSMLYLDYSRAVGQWTPNVHGGRENLEAVEFVKQLNESIHRNHPDVVTIAEESTSWPGVTACTDEFGLGFDLKWNMGWMHDTLSYFHGVPCSRTSLHNKLSFASTYAWEENFILPLSHDEVVHAKGSLWGKMPGDESGKASSLRGLLAFMWAHPGKQSLFMGGEIGQVREWSETRSLDWQLLADPQHVGVQRLVTDLNAAYQRLPALYTQDNSQEGFEWIEADDSDHSVFAFLRIGRGRSMLVFVANFSDVGRTGYRVGLPCEGEWVATIHTGSTLYGGSQAGEFPSLIAQPQPWQGQPMSVLMDLPPHNVFWLEPAEQAS